MYVGTLPSEERRFTTEKSNYFFHIQLPLLLSCVFSYAWGFLGVVFGLVLFFCYFFAV